MSGLAKKVIVVCAEKMSSMTDYEDRSTCPLFGDAAAAVLVEGTEENVGVMDAEVHVDGDGLPHLLMKAGGSVKPASHETVDAREHYIYQEGRVVYKHAVRNMLSSTLSVMSRNNLTVVSSRNPGREGIGEYPAHRQYFGRIHTPLSGRVQVPAQEG